MQDKIIWQVDRVIIIMKHHKCTQWNLLYLLFVHTWFISLFTKCIILFLSTNYVKRLLLIFHFFCTFVGSGLHNLVIVEDGGGGTADGGNAKGFAYDNPGFMDESSEAKSKR